MTFDLRVRSATSGDLPALVDFNLRLAAETESKALDRAVLERGVAAVLADPAKGFYALAECSSLAPSATSRLCTSPFPEPSQPVGALLVTYEWSDWRNGLFWWIQSVYVPLPFRRLGVYRALHSAIRALAQHSQTACGLRLYVERQNHAAQSTYAALGMLPTPYALFEEVF